MLHLTRRRWAGTPRTGNVLSTLAMQTAELPVHKPSTTYHQRTSTVGVRQSGIAT